MEDTTKHDVPTPETAPATPAAPAPEVEVEPKADEKAA